MSKIKAIRAACLAERGRKKNWDNKCANLLKDFLPFDITQCDSVVGERESRGKEAVSGFHQ